MKKDSIKVLEKLAEKGGPWVSEEQKAIREAIDLMKAVKVVDGVLPKEKLDSGFIFNKLWFWRLQEYSGGEIVFSERDIKKACDDIKYLFDEQRKEMVTAMVGKLCKKCLEGLNGE